MKQVLMLLIAVLIGAGCDNRDTHIDSLNDLPYFTLDGDTIVSYVDSTKLSTGRYNIRAVVVDPNENIAKVKVSSTGLGTFFLGGVQIDGEIEVTSQSISLGYVPSGASSHELAFEVEDDFGASAILSVSLVSFTNLDPVANLDIVHPEGVGPFERNLDASTSFDQDASYGGSIREYEYTFLGKIVTKSGNSQTAIFPDNGTYSVSVRVKDNDDVWSEPVSKNVIIEP